MIEQAYRFQLDGNPIHISQYGSGHINESYLLVDSTAREYLLQKINRNVFKDPLALMQNIADVTTHMKTVVSSPRESLSLVPAKDGQNWVCDEAGEYWRLYEFITDSMCLDKAASLADFQESGEAFGRFQSYLADFQVEGLNETIPRFHDTPNRYSLFHNSLALDVMNRAKDVSREIDFVLEREEYASTLMLLQERGSLPQRVTHNDTKLNNVLFDRFSRKALCVIDLDTVMPGIAANDFGDSIRFGASTAAEDERDLSKVSFSLELFEAYTRGYLRACGKMLTECELEHLCDGAKIMALECGVRFLTDYLSGDTYFRTHREDHNLDRCRTQFVLVADMERQWGHMKKIINAEKI